MGKDSTKTKKKERKELQKTYKEVKKKYKKPFSKVFCKKLPEGEDLKKELERVVQRLQNIIDDIRKNLIPEFQTSDAYHHKHYTPDCSSGKQQPSRPVDPQPDYDDDDDVEYKPEQTKHTKRREEGAKFMKETEERENLKHYQKEKGRVEQRRLEEAIFSPAQFTMEKEDLERKLKEAKIKIENCKLETKTSAENFEKKKQELEDELKNAKAEIENYKQKRHELEQVTATNTDNDNKREIKQLLRTKEVLEQEKNTMIRQLDKLQKELDNQKSQVNKLISEKKEALTRLSELAGRQLLDNNPNIADLSTEIRPTKIGENFMQVYDNEWTDAFEELQQNGKEDKQCIRFLLKIVQEAFKYARAKAHDFEAEMVLIINSCSANRTRGTTSDQKNKRSQTAENLTKEELGLIRQLKKASAARTKTSIQNDFVEKELPKGPKIQMFAEKCVEMCWYMAIQTPPMALMFDMRHMHPFDEKYYKKYMTSGDRFDFLVWPCTLLHKDGPIVAKGIAEATTTDAAQTETPVTAANDTKQDKQNQIGTPASKHGRGYGKEIKTAEEFHRSVKSGYRGDGEIKNPRLPKGDTSTSNSYPEQEGSVVKDSRENIPSRNGSEQNVSKGDFVTKLSCKSETKL